jgi:hypothetical protein
LQMKMKAMLFVALGSFLVVSAWAQQAEGNIHKQWKPPSAPDGKVETVVSVTAAADGAPPDPEGCKVVVSNDSCLRILCKAEAAIYDNSPQGRSAAANRARIWAKSHYLQFMKDGGKIQEAAEMLADEARKEGVTSTSYVDSLKKAAQFASEGNISGFVIVEDGTADGMRYAVGGTSCITQQAAGQAQRANAALSQGRMPPSSGANPNDSGSEPAPQRRRSSGNF